MIEQSNPGVNLKEDKPNEAIIPIPDNRTLIITKLNEDPPSTPEINDKCTTVKEVFDHYKPTVQLSLKDENNIPVNEEITFNNLGDFGKNGIVKKSKFLQKLDQDKKDSQSFLQVVRSNKVMERILNNPETREAYVTVLKDLIQELETAESK